MCGLNNVRSMKEKAKNEYRCAVSRFVWLVVLMLALPALRGQA